MRTLELLAGRLLYGELHRLTAATAWKARVAARVGERVFHGLYRLSYTVVSVVSLLPILALMAAGPGRTVWTASGVTVDVLRALRVAAVIGLALALLQIDGLRFLGIK